MPRYELFGRELDSDMPLPELPAAAAGVPVRLSFERIRPAPHDGGWFAIWRRPDGAPAVRACRTPSGYRIEYSGCAEFDVSPRRGLVQGDTIECPEELFRHFLLDQVMPLAMTLETPVLHASSLAIDGRFVAFSGCGGAGKSTLAIALARRGHALGGDDALRVDARDAGVDAVAAYPGVRLWEDSERAVAADLAGSGRTERIAKQRFSSGLRVVRGARALTRVYVLDPASAGAIAFERLSPRDAAIELLSATYRLALDDRAAIAREFDTLTSVASRVECWRLRFPRRLDAWPALAADVEAHVRGIPDSRTPDAGRRTSDPGPRTSELPA